MTTENSPETTPRHYDVIIIGTGSGNSIPAPAYDNVRIALVEEGRFGGTCLNVGCIPTKMFVLAADAARNIREASRLGVHGTFDSVDLKQIQDRVLPSASTRLRTAARNTAAGTRLPISMSTTATQRSSALALFAPASARKPSTSQPTTSSSLQAPALTFRASSETPGSITTPMRTSCASTSFRAK